LRQDSVSGTITQNLRLPGQFFDLESGANHNGFRNYVPDIGRYAEPDPLAMQGSTKLYDPITGLITSKDPLSFAEGGNFYSYAENNPIDFDDPSGEQALPKPIPGPIPVPTPSPEPPATGVPWGWGGFFFFLFNPQQLNAGEDAAMARIRQQQLEYDAYKSACNGLNLPASMDPCARLSREIDHAKRCAALRQAWDDRWMRGRHSQEIQGWLNRLQNLKDEHNSKCTNKCR